MKKILKIVLPILIALCSLQTATGQTIFKNEKQTSKIENKGTIRFTSAGNVLGMPDTIGGRVEFTDNDAAKLQIIPNVTYHQLMVSGRTPRFVDSVWNIGGYNPLRTLDSLVFRNQALVIADSVEVHAKATVANDAEVWGRKDVVLNAETNSQNLEGTGQFTRVKIENPHGVDVTRGGGFVINHKLELRKGELRNNSGNNFDVGDSVLIIRHVEGSISYAPGFRGKHITIRYVGDGSITTGPEVPKDSSVLKNLYVETTQGIILSDSVTVNDTLYLVSNINTEPDSLNRYVLTHADVDNPIFANTGAEVIGSFRRTNLRFDGTQNIFNNIHTYALFTDSASSGGVRKLTFRVKPRTYPPFFQGDLKVRRFIQIRAQDVNYDPVDQNFQMTTGYGWRVAMSEPVDETNGLNIPELILQRWTGNEWFDITNSREPTVDSVDKWAFSFAEVLRTGDFAIGMPGGYQLAINSRVWLEGPYRYGSMAQDLRVKGLVPKTPPDMYPYNLDPNRQIIQVNQIPDSVVDWIVLEFRPSFNSGQRYYRTCFIRSDGRIVDMDGTSPVLLSRGGIDSGEYFVAVHHRNHLAVITEDKVGIYPETVQRVLDFSQPSLLMGRNSALKPIDIDDDGAPVFGMIGGDINGDGKIDKQDQIGVWEDRDYENLYLNTDAIMSGHVTTRDFNIPWNNRGRFTLVP